MLTVLLSIPINTFTIYISSKPWLWFLWFFHTINTYICRIRVWWYITFGSSHIACSAYQKRPTRYRGISKSTYIYIRRLCQSKLSWKHLSTHWLNYASSVSELNHLRIIKDNRRSNWYKKSEHILSRWDPLKVSELQ